MNGQMAEWKVRWQWQVRWQNDRSNTTRSILKLCDICHLTFHSVTWSFILWHDLLFYDLTFHSTIWPVILPSDLSLSSDLSFHHLTFHSTIWPVILPSDLSRELWTIKKLQTISLYNFLVETFQSRGLLGSHRVIALYNVSLINIAMTLSFWCKVV
jgi:hypothetical protein